MKHLIAIVCLGFITAAYAGETKTECQSMNQSREKILKDPVTLKNSKGKSKGVGM